jgi:hypothetical protein
LRDPPCRGVASPPQSTRKLTNQTVAVLARYDELTMGAKKWGEPQPKARHGEPRETLRVSLGEAIYRVSGQGAFEGLARFEHGVQCDDELSDDGDDSQLVRFSVGSQPFVEGLERGVVVACAERGHEQNVAQGRTVEPTDACQSNRRNTRLNKMVR